MEESLRMTWIRKRLMDDQEPLTLDDCQFLLAEYDKLSESHWGHSYNVLAEQCEKQRAALRQIATLATAEGRERLAARRKTMETFRFDFYPDPDKSGEYVKAEIATALLEALKSAQKSVCSLQCPSLKQTGEEWTHREECTRITALIATAEGR